MWAPVRSLSSAERAKELLEKSLTFLGFNVPNDAGWGTEAIVETKVVERAHSTLSGISRAKDDDRDARESNSAEAHRAWLKGDTHDAIVESPRTEFFGRFSDCVDLRVRDDRLVLFGGVASRSDDRVVVRDDRADRNFTSVRGALGVTDSFGHQVVYEFGGWWGVHFNCCRQLRLARWEGDPPRSPECCASPGVVRRPRTVALPGAGAKRGCQEKVAERGGFEPPIQLLAV